MKFLQNQWCSYAIHIMIWLGCMGLIYSMLYIGHGDISDQEQVDSSAGKRVLRVLAWGDLFDKTYMQKFEAQEGITVHIGAYTSNEELLVKLRATGGAEYDVIFPSDYAVKILRDHNLLKHIDTSKIPGFDAILLRLNPHLLGQPYDPANEYSLPYSWEIFGIAYDKDFFAQHPHLLQRSWSVLFDNPHGAYRVTSSNDPLEVVRAVAHYLFGPVDWLSDTQVALVQQRLRMQHQWVEAYSSTNLDYYIISGYAPIAFSSSAYVGRRKQFASRIGFFVPQEGGLATIENVALPIRGENEDLVYKFIEFIYRSEAMKHHAGMFTYFPATNDLLSNEELDPEIRVLLTMPESDFRRLIFIKQIIPEDRMNDLWVSVKS